MEIVGSENKEEDMNGLAFRIVNKLLNEGCIVSGVSPTHIQELVDGVLASESKLSSLSNQRIKMEEVEKRAEVLWIGLGVMNEVIQILQREYGIPRVKAKRILRRVRCHLGKANESKAKST